MTEEKENHPQSEEEIEQSLRIEKTPEELIPRYNVAHKVAILNGPVMTSYGNFINLPLAIEAARILTNSADISSYLGHHSTAQIISTLLHRPIGYSRKKFVQKVGQLALVFTLNDRAPEGKILSLKEVEDIGYSFQLVWRRG